MNSIFRSIANFFNRLFGKNTIAPEFPDIQNPIENTGIIKPQVNLPEIKTPGIKVPDVKVPEIEVPEINIPEVKIPEIEVPEIKIPEVEIPDVKIPEVEVPEIKIPEVEVNVPEIPPVAENPVTNTDKPEPVVVSSPVREETPVQPVVTSGELPLALQIRLKRHSAGTHDTIGKMSINGMEYCYSLEEAKSKAIPAGKYEIMLRSAGGIHATYATRYKDMHKGMLWLQNVPGFKYIYFQIGQDNSDTQGCIIIGNEVVNENDPGARRVVRGSKAAYLRIYTPVAEYLLRGGKVFINIED